MIQTASHNLKIRAGLVLAFLMCAAPSLWAQEAIPFQEDYDVEAHVGTLSVPGPDRSPVVIRRRSGLQVQDIIEMKHDGQAATLVLWSGFPNGQWLYPELWWKEGNNRVRRVWPSNPHLDWEHAEVETTEIEGTTQVVITRQISSTRIQTNPVRTRETFQIDQGSLQLIEKHFSKWGTPEQLLSVVADLLATGQHDQVPLLLNEFQARKGKLSAGATRQLETLLTTYLERSGGISKTKEVE